MNKLETTYRSVFNDSGLAHVDRIAMIAMLVWCTLNKPSPEQKAMALEPKE